LSVGPAILETNAPLPRRRGKVRDVYDLDDRLVLVATDRISAFDWVLPSGVPDKGRVLTRLSLWWFDRLATPNHVLSADLAEIGPPFSAEPELYSGRSVLCRKLEIVPFECVVRGYLAGSGWKEYRASGAVCGHRLPPGLLESDRLPEPIFTPATKATEGHDENITVAEMARRAGSALTARLERLSIDLYTRGAAIAAERGIILADTKFEFGLTPEGELLLADEALTPDSSRYWPADRYRPGGSPPSFDKQFVRDWLESIGFDKKSTPPEMPAEIIEKSRARYVEAFERLTGTSF
jgi:phosphoribosylaminoimidazole-succinocarboxamide synthase